MLPIGGVVDVDAVEFFEDITARSILMLGRNQNLAVVATQALQCPRARRSIRAGFCIYG